MVESQNEMKYPLLDVEDLEHSKPEICPDEIPVTVPVAPKKDKKVKQKRNINQ